jgi:hypothetical protein
VLGAVLVFAALIAAAFPLLVVLVVVDDVREGRQTSAFEPDALRALLLFVVGTIVGLWVGLRLIRGRRRLGLYLRKFGFGESTRTERDSTKVIDNAWAIATTARTVAARTRRILSPRLVVVRVASSVWQNAVQGLASVADVVVIDVSHPTDALLWEVATMKPLFRTRWVLVGSYDQVVWLGHPQVATAADARGQLARALDGEDVIAYGAHPADQKRFSRALRHRLHQIPRR